MQQTDVTPTLTPVGNPLALKDIIGLLIKHYDIHEGLYDLSIEFTIGIGAVGPPDSIVPGAMIGVQRIGLVKTSAMGPTTIDAADVNPQKKPRK